MKKLLFAILLSILFSGTLLAQTDSLKVESLKNENAIMKKALISEYLSRTGKDLETAFVELYMFSIDAGNKNKQMANMIIAIADELKKLNNTEVDAIIKKYGLE